ncbi:MAG: hypothetical protein GX316_03100, partial [Firmicutes bacterium]|nr:hypothetical protein [Bacillota bacterium]
RDLLETYVEVQLPQGLKMVNDDIGGSQDGSGEIDTHFGRVRVVTGPLRRGESEKVLLKLVVGLDIASPQTSIKAAAFGFAQSEKVHTPTITKKITLGEGPFVQTTPRTQIDSHVLVPVGETTVLELLVKPEIQTGPPPPFVKEDSTAGRVQRSGLVGVSEALTLHMGSLDNHRMRLRLDSGEQVLEGGLWHHSLYRNGLPDSELAIGGIQGAARLGEGLVLRGFYGVLDNWPIHSLHPANNTAGPFPLKTVAAPNGKIDCRLISWDEVEQKWHVESPVSPQIDHDAGIFTLARPVKEYNAAGRRQYIAVSYEGQKLGSGFTWKELSLEMAAGGRSLTGSYLETGEQGEIKLAALTGILAEEKLRMHAKLGCLLGENPQVLGRAVENSAPGRCAWQIAGALEVLPQMRLGGAWSLDSIGLGEFSSLTLDRTNLQDDMQADQREQKLDDLMIQLEDWFSGQKQVLNTQVSTYLPLGKEWIRILCAEVDLGDGWSASLLTQKAGLLIKDEAEPHLVEQTASKGWEKSIAFQTDDLTKWRLGCGQRTNTKITDQTHGHSQEESQYGFLSISSTGKQFEWDGSLTLSQNRHLQNKSFNPLGVSASFSASYECGSLKPYIRSTHELAPTKGKEANKPHGRELTLGVQAEVGPRWQLDLAHSHSERQERQAQVVSMKTNYQLSAHWVLFSNIKWEPFEGGIGLRGKSPSGVTLDLVWNRPNPVDKGRGLPKTLDEFTLSLAQSTSKGCLTKQEIALKTTVEAGKCSAWEIRGEGDWRLSKSWEAWLFGAYKETAGNNPIITRQCIVRLSRRLNKQWAGFGQIGSWQQLDKREIGYSLGLSRSISSNAALAVGCTWQDSKDVSTGGLLSAAPGLFIQVFAR